MKIGIVGAGIFGCLIATEIAIKGHEVTIFESESEILKKASRVNQARLHTGMHYPRDFETAKEALQSYESFKSTFSSAVKELDQYYAISKASTKTTPEEYLNFANEIGIDFLEIKPETFFKDNVVELLLKVPESTFDIDILKFSIESNLEKNKNIELKLNCAIKAIFNEEFSPTVITEDGTNISFDKIIFSSYAMSRKHFKKLSLQDLKIEYQICQVVLGRAPKLNNTGITVMDGPFWSIMPYGKTSLHSLTNVKYTPLSISMDDKLDCQKIHEKCGDFTIYDCNTCLVRPSGNETLMLRELDNDLKENVFEYFSSIHTVKAIISSSINPNAARPTQLLKDRTGNLLGVLSGKIGSAIPLSKEIAEMIEG
jgi:hypothetical protein